MSGDLIKNPIVQVALALIVILVIATLSFASAISGALNTLRGHLLVFPHINQNLMCVQTAEKLRTTLPLRNCNHSSWFARFNWTNVGIKKSRRLVASLTMLITRLTTRITPSMISFGV